MRTKLERSVHEVMGPGRRAPQGTARSARPVPYASLITSRRPGRPLDSPSDSEIVTQFRSRPLAGRVFRTKRAFLPGAYLACCPPPAHEPALRHLASYDK